MKKQLDITNFSTDNQRIEYLEKAINCLLRYQTPILLKDESTINWDYSKGYNAYVTLKGNRTLDISNLSELKGDYGTLVIYQDGTGGRTLTLPAGSQVGNGGAGILTLTATTNAKDIVSFYYDEKGILNFNVIPNFN